MKTRTYLIFDKNGFVTARKTEYSLKPGQICISIDFNLPQILFKQPILHGSIEVSEEEVQDKVITELEFELKRLKSED